MANLGCKHGHFNCTECGRLEYLEKLKARTEAVEARADRYRVALKEIADRHNGRTSRQRASIASAALKEPANGETR